MQCANFQIAVIININTVINIFLQKLIKSFLFYFRCAVRHSIRVKIVVNNPSAVFGSVNIALCAVKACLAGLFKCRSRVFRSNRPEASVRHKINILCGLINSVIRCFAILIKSHKACRNHKQNKRKQHTEHNNQYFFLFTHFLFGSVIFTHCRYQLRFLNFPHWGILKFAPCRPQTDRPPICP